MKEIHLLILMHLLEVQGLMGYSLGMEALVGTTFMLFLYFAKTVGCHLFFSWWMSSLHFPSATLHSTSISWREGFTHVWCPDFCSFSLGDTSSPGSRGQGMLVFLGPKGQ